MYSRKGLLVLAFALVLSGVAIGCHHPPPPPRAAVVPASLSGIYNGTHALDFEITSPTRQRMPSDRRPGPIHVYEETSGVRINLRLYENGEPCLLYGTRQAGTGRVVINPGQRCSLRFVYQGTPVIAAMQINRGVADFDGANLRTNMTGPFVADAYVSGARQSLSGNARIVFSGTRLPSR